MAVICDCHHIRSLRSSLIARYWVASVRMQSFSGPRTSACMQTEGMVRLKA